MSNEELLKLFFRQADGVGSRSTTLNPLGWLIFILLSGTLTSLHFASPSWLLITLLVFMGATIILYFFVYIYFMLKNPDALRTEKFTLKKMEIEKSFGDSTTGEFERDKNKKPLIGELEVHKEDAYG